MAIDWTPPDLLGEILTDTLKRHSILARVEFMNPLLWFSSMEDFLRVRIIIPCMNGDPFRIFD